MVINMNETTLLKKLKQKRQSALDAAIELYTPYISVVLFNISGGRFSPEDIEEIVSDTFIALWKNAAGIDPEKGSVKSYLAGTARNLAAMRLRARAMDSVPIDENEISDCGGAAEELIKSDDAKTLWRAVAALGETDCEIFVRYYKYGEKIKDISAAMSLNVSTVKTKLARGKKKLKKRLSEEGLL